MRDLSLNEVSRVSGGCVSDAVCGDPNVKIVVFLRENWMHEKYTGQFGPGEILKLEQSIEVIYEGAMF